LLTREPTISAQISKGIAEAKVRNIPELVEQFERMKPKVLELAERYGFPF